MSIKYLTEKEMKSTVLFEKHVYEKIMYLVHKAPGEISGLGTLRILDNGNFLITSAILCQQENTGSSTDLDPQDVSRAMFELREAPGELKFWWHSHANMPVFWSGTDTQNMADLVANGDYFVSTVFNKKGEFRTAIYQKKPYRCFIDEIESVVFSPDSPLTESWDKEYEEKCKVKTYAPAWARSGSENKEEKKETKWELEKRESTRVYSNLSSVDRALIDQVFRKRLGLS